MAACITSLTRPPLPPELEPPPRPVPPPPIGEALPKVDGSPRIGYVPPAPGSRPAPESIGTSLGATVGLPSPGAVPAGLVSPGLDSAGLSPAPGVATPAPGVVGSAPGVVSPGVVGAAPGLVRPGLVKPGLVRPGLVRPGLVAPGLVRPGLVRPGVPRPGVPRPGLPRPGLARPGVLVAPPLRAGTGGRLIPNCDRPCDSAPISSPGRSLITAACLNSWCSGALLPAVDS
ncbi:hypothetical protein CKJ55_00825 [Mycobacterium avium]|uniref:Uncharacterized protein n=1 Tax=Mycobacterium avium TaxID=1764 RepID=A0A2A2ZP70_MYCAV|nr:hypothetical protein CKJ66_00930 [Mycobacterium avium]PBJ29594.1 hypothetical protein BI294_24375 [Mycobacterium avium subsp. hominissuis]PBA43081.1 hypothetical protein CKJ63_00820 [Mycobacterium avium]PBA68476.1 hypothetical protein CKJ55_00825 [Mycobacterium avium]PBA84969.1 hypothetical protein CKJ72_01215 [Mycobacterium avium]